VVVIHINVHHVLFVRVRAEVRRLRLVVVNPVGHVHLLIVIAVIRVPLPP
jgi:hypothetical protein